MMKYNVGDKVELKNGYVVTIDGILGTSPNAYSYTEIVRCCLPEEDILRKIED